MSNSPPHTVHDREHRHCSTASSVSRTSSDNSTLPTQPSLGLTITAFGLATLEHSTSSSPGSTSFTPPASPHTISKEHSIQELFRSARNAFGGKLQPGEGDLAAVEHPVRTRPSRMVTAQDWSARDGSAAAEEQPATAAEEAHPRARTVSVPTKTAGPLMQEAMAEGAQAHDEEKCGGGATPPSSSAREREVVASAPGKVILFGEHAVVYGKPAVGAAVSDLRIIVTGRATTEGVLVLELPDLAVSFRRPMAEVAAAFGDVLREGLADSVPTPPTAWYLESISAFVGDDWAEEKKKAILPLVFLVLALAARVVLGQAGSAAQGLRVTAVSASLPVGAGLGSSAALCVATSAALCRLSALLESPQPGARSEEAQVRGSTRPSDAELALINAWAFAGETVLHGTPSGLDNTVSCYGGAIKFIRGMNGAANVTEPILGFPPIPILITNTRVPKDTRALVAGVRRLSESHRAPVATTFDAIGAVAEEFLERAAAGSAKDGGLSHEGGNGAATLTAECVGELAEINHRLLCVLGVGHPALDRVCDIARSHGCKSKLTGAGGGGCALTVLAGEEDSSPEALRADMVSEGFECYESALGGEGVLWHEDGVPPGWMASASAASSGGAGRVISDKSRDPPGAQVAGSGKWFGLAALGALAVAAVAWATFVAERRRRF